MAIQTSQRLRNAPFEIPDKLYFKIGEVARICEVPTYVLRFWESEFHQLKPNKSGTGQRLYRKRDVEMALRIKRLLYDEGYTISGARQVFLAEAREHRKKAADPELPLQTNSNAAAVGLEKVRRELRELSALLSAPVGSMILGGRSGRQNRIARTPAEHKPTNLFEM
jgi:DNA-binding transcriptional MerR regulator